jgi:hypothetical protein
MEYNTARSIPILFLVEYRIQYDIGILEEFGIPEEFDIHVEFRILRNTAQDIILYEAQKVKGPFRKQPCPTDINTSK